MTSVSSFVTISESSFCGFDSGLCAGWQQSSADVFDWKSHTGSTTSSSTGPEYDHTSGLGKRKFIINILEQFSIECRKTKTNVITSANHKRHGQSSGPIKTRSKYM